MSGFQEKVMKFADNQYVVGLAYLLIILYASLAAPNLPPRVAKLFSYNPFRFLFCFLIAYFAMNKNVSAAIILSIAFIVSVQTLNRISFEEQARQWLMMPASSKSAATQQQMKQTDAVVQPSQMTSQPSSLYGPDTGFEVGSGVEPCYGDAGMPGYDYADKLSQY